MNIEPITKDLITTKELISEVNSEIVNENISKIQNPVEGEISVDSKDEETVITNNQNPEKTSMSKNKAEKKLAKLQRKLEKLESKLENASSDKKEAKLEKKIDKIEGKIDYYEGMLDIDFTGDKKTDKLAIKKYKLEFKAENTDSDKKAEKLEKKIDKLEEKLETREDALDIDDEDVDETEDDDDDDELDDNEKASLGKKAENLSQNLPSTSDTKLLELYEQLGILKDKINSAKNDDELFELEIELDDIEDDIEERNDELEELKTSTSKLNKLNMFLECEESLFNNTDDETQKSEIAAEIFTLKSGIADVENQQSILK